MSWPDGPTPSPRGLHREGSRPDAPAGALVVGGEHPGLEVARSLGRRGIPVCVLDDQLTIASFSRYVRKVVRVPDLLDQRRTVDAVLEMGRRYRLHDWVLFPTRDETVAAFSRHRARLSEFFHVTTGEWESIRWVANKRRTYELAAKLEIPHPRTVTPRCAGELRELFPRLPLAIKPAVKENFFYATGAKAWRAETPGELVALYDRARRHIMPAEILVQEIIPGDGASQYSYCAFFRHGCPVSSLCARRLRQHPREFGRAASFVETVEAPEVEELAERFLRAIGYHGVVEVEFKLDPRDGQYKLLDVNARTWGFHRIGPAAGIDFSYLAYADQMDLPLEPSRGRAGVGWMRLVADVPTVISEFAHRGLSLEEYLRSLSVTRVESVLSWRDPLPSAAEILLLPYLVAKKLSHQGIRLPAGTGGRRAVPGGGGLPAGKD